MPELALKAQIHRASFYYLNLQNWLRLLFDMIWVIKISRIQNSSSGKWLGSSVRGNDKCIGTFWIKATFSKRQNNRDDCSNFCGLLRKAELYQLRCIYSFYWTTYSSATLYIINFHEFIFFLQYKTTKKRENKKNPALWSNKKLRQNNASRSQEFFGKIMHSTHGMIS